MKLQQLYSYTRKAIDHYQLIESGDKIAIGISGGKDSLTLLYALSGLRRFYPQKFDLVAVTVDLGYENFDLTAVSKLCHDLDVPYHIVNTEIAKILFEERNEKPTCSLCAKMRKGLIPWQYFVEIATFMIVIFPGLRYNDGIRNLNTVRK